MIKSVKSVMFRPDKKNLTDQAKTPWEITKILREVCRVCKVCNVFEGIIKNKKLTKGSK